MWYSSVGDGRMAIRPRCAQRPATSARKRLAAGVAVRREPVARREHALAAQHRADGEEVGRRAHVVHAQHVRARVRGPADRGERRRAALARARGP